MTYNDAKLTIESADERLPPATLLPVLQGLVKQIEYLTGRLDGMKERVEKSEREALMHYGALTALRDRLSPGGQP